jgi:DNA-binding protein HU-beta
MANKAQLIEALSERLGDKKVASEAVDGLVDIIIRTVNKGEKVNITGFGVFEKRARAARTARNPRTGETVRVKKTNVPAFRAGTTFKDVVSGTKKLPKATVAKRATAGTGTRVAAATRGTAARTTATRPTATRSTTTRTPRAAAGTTTTRSTRSNAAKTTTAAKLAAKPAPKAAEAKATTAKKSAATKAAVKPAAAKATAAKAPRKKTTAAAKK